MNNQQMITYTQYYSSQYCCLNATFSDFTESETHGIFNVKFAYYENKNWYILATKLYCNGYNPMWASQEMTRQIHSEKKAAKIKEKSNFETEISTECKLIQEYFK